MLSRSTYRWNVKFVILNNCQCYIVLFINCCFFISIIKCDSFLGSISINKSSRTQCCKILFTAWYNKIKSSASLLFIFLHFLMKFWILYICNHKIEIKNTYAKLLIQYKLQIIVSFSSVKLCAIISRESTIVQFSLVI